MSEEVNSHGAVPFQNEGRFHNRILAIMGSLALAGAVLTGLAVSPRFGAGFLVGGLFSVANYYWIKKTTRKFFEKAVKGQATGMMGLRFVLRYFLLGVVLATVYITGIVPVIAVLLGLSGFALAVVIEGIYSIFNPVRV
ncbi:MAG: ATP synthase subunit I [Acidobacteriota bacterium]|nr:ATP synthase subunit I [Acidobacteriota bacterium]